MGLAGDGGQLEYLRFGCAVEVPVKNRLESGGERNWSQSDLAGGRSRRRLTRSRPENTIPALPLAYWRAIFKLKIEDVFDDRG
jgi:hypothetical protein